MSRTIAFLLISYFCSVYTATTFEFNVNYEHCLRNIRSTKKLYADLYYAKQQDKKADIERLVSMIKNQVAEELSPICRDAFPQRTALYYDYKVFQICGGILLINESSYEPHWKGWSDEKTCGWIIENGPPLFETFKNNQEVQQLCDYKAVFDKYYYDKWMECEELNRKR